jgi:transposase-like protein
MVAVPWYLRYGPSYRDVEELLADRGIGIDHVTRVISAGHAFVQNLCRGHHNLGVGVGVDPWHRLAARFTELVRAL